MLFANLASLKTRTKTPGSPPGTLLYTGKKPPKPVCINVLKRGAGANTQAEVYSSAEAFLESHSVASQPHSAEQSHDAGVYWVDVFGLHDDALLQALGKAYGLDAIALEAAMDIRQRCKLEPLENGLFLVLKMLEVTPNDTVAIEQVSVFVSSSTLLVFLEDDEDLLNPVRERFKAHKIAKGTATKKHGTDYWLVAVLACLSSHYLLVLETVTERVDTLESRLHKLHTDSLHQRIYRVQHQLGVLRKALAPLKHVLEELKESTMLKAESRRYLKTVQEQVLDCLEQLDSNKNHLESLENRYLALSSNKMNSSMQVLTTFTALFMPLTFIVGVYGMNFKHMPELEWKYGYPTVWGLMVLVTLVQFIIFKQKKWF